jgi:hypothetical protein
MKRINIAIQKNLSFSVLKCDKNTISFLRKIGISVESYAIDFPYIMLFTDVSTNIFEQYSKPITDDEYNSLTVISLDGISHKLQSLSLEVLKEKIYNHIYFSPYGMHFKLSNIDNWKPISLDYLLGFNSFKNDVLYSSLLFKDYFLWIVEKNPQFSRKYSFLESKI